jgi:hypothetical protein
VRESLQIVGADKSIEKARRLEAAGLKPSPSA